VDEVDVFVSHLIRRQKVFIGEVEWRASVSIEFIYRHSFFATCVMFIVSEALMNKNMGRVKLEVCVCVSVCIGKRESTLSVRNECVFVFWPVRFSPICYM
jgi:hypothetical protein